MKDVNCDGQWLYECLVERAGPAILLKVNPPWYKRIRLQMDNAKG